MKIRNFSLVIIAIFSSFVLFSSCNNSTFVKEYAERVAEKCPIIVNETMTITGATYDGDQLTYKILLDESLVNISTIKSDDFKKLAAISMGNKGLFSNELIDHNVSVVYSFKGNKTGAKHNVVVSSEEMKDMSVSNMDISQIYDIVLTSSVNMAKQDIPYEIDNGVSIVDMEVNDTALVCVYKMSDRLYDVSKLNSKEVKQYHKNTIKYTDDNSTITQIRLLVNTKRSLVYKYVGERSKKELIIVFSPTELMHIKIRD